jgi:hypothetical protein
MIGPRCLEDLESLSNNAGDIAGALGNYMPKEPIAAALTRLASAVEAQTDAQDRIGRNIVAAIEGITTEGVSAVLEDMSRCISQDLSNVSRSICEFHHKGHSND